MCVFVCVRVYAGMFVVCVSVCMSVRPPCSLIPPSILFLHSVPSTPGWLPFRPLQFFASDQMPTDPSDIGYNPHLVRQHQGVCMYLCGVP